MIFTAFTLCTSAFATQSFEQSINGTIAENSKYCCNNTDDFAAFLYDTSETPWLIDNDYALNRYGEDNGYMNSVLDIYFNKTYLADDTLALPEGITFVQQTEQLIYLQKVIENVSYSEDLKDDISDLLLLLNTLKPKPDSLNYAQRLNLYTHFSDNEEKKNWLDLLFNDFEKPIALSFIETTTK